MSTEAPTSTDNQQETEVEVLTERNGFKIVKHSFQKMKDGTPTDLQGLNFSLIQQDCCT